MGSTSGEIAARFKEFWFRDGRAGLCTGLSSRTIRILSESNQQHSSIVSFSSEGHSLYVLSWGPTMTIILLVVGVLVLTSVLLAVYHDLDWLWLTALIGALCAGVLYRLTVPS